MALVKAPVNKKRLKEKRYRTDNIMDLVNEVAVTDRDDTERLAKQFAPTRRGLKQLFDFVDDNFVYEEDPPANQWVQTPSYLYHTTQKGDCKSFTVFISSVLYNMGIPHLIRYTAYGSKDYRHVYPVALLHGKEIPLDVVWHKQENGAFGKEKSFTKKQDFKMEGLYKLGNTEQSALISLNELEQVLADIPDSIIDEGIGDITQMSSGELDRVIMKERLEIFADQETRADLRREYQRGIVAIDRGTVAGIGNMINSPFGANLEQFLRNTAHDNAPSFTPFTLAIPNPNTAQVQGMFGWVKKIGGAFKKLFSKLMNWVFKGPARKMAPYFLFTFIKKVTSSGEINKRKAAQEKSYNWIKKVGKFDDRKLKGMIFNEIKKESGMTPEQLLNKGAEKQIAALPVAVMAFAPKIMKALGLVVEVVKKIAGLFKKNKSDAGTISEENAPDLTLLEELHEKPVDTDSGGGSGLAIAAGLAALAVFVI